MRVGVQRVGQRYEHTVYTTAERKECVSNTLARKLQQRLIYMYMFLCMGIQMQCNSMDILK